MVDENGMDGHTTMQPEQYHPIAWLCYTWAVITLPTQGKPLSAATLQNPVTPSPILLTKPQFPIPPPPMLRFGDIITDWLLVAQPYLEQAPSSQRVALLYTLLETTLRQHVHAQLERRTQHSRPP